MILGHSLLIRKPPPPTPHRRISTAKFTSYVSLSAKSAAERVKTAESLQYETLKILEWPSVCNQLSAFTSTPMGLTAAKSALIPLGRSPEESKHLLLQTSAAVSISRPLDFSGIEDVSPIVEAAIAGEMLSFGKLCCVQRTLKSARSLIEQLEGIASESSSIERCSPLLEILQKCDFPVHLEKKIDFCIDCNLSFVLDRASEELEIIRFEKKTNMENLELLLKQVSARIFQSGGIDRPIVTERRSRMCVAVRSTHRSLLPNGVILDSSSSGATYFIEPREAVDLNNLEVRLSAAEKMEEQAILSFLGSEIAKSGSQIMYLLDRVLEVDLACARAAHARWTKGTCPNYAEHDIFAIDVTGMRHPLLLELSLGKPPDHSTSMSRYTLDQETDINESDSGPGDSTFPVPVDFKIGHGVKVVVISGPNTGGKTASMKALGLASIMLKAGMYLPALKHPHIPWFDLVLADIGDQQSLEQSLSTFSGHMSRICDILKVATKRSLVLLDEIGSGTDPSEGLALSTSILQYLKDRVNLVVVTTHYADLTRLKEKDAGFENAAMEFSLVSLQPTYRILWGSMGESNALNIAQTIGFDREVIEGAKSWLQKLTPEKMQKHNTLLYQSLAGEKITLQTQAEEITILHSEIMELYHEIQNEADDLEEREVALKRKATKELRQKLNVAKTEINVVVHEFEEHLRNASRDDLLKHLKHAESAIASIVQTHQPFGNLPVETAVPSFHVPRIGEQVLVKSLGNKLATVVEAPADDNTVLVQYGKIRVRLNLSSIKSVADGNDSSTSKRRLTGQDQGIKRLRNLPESKPGEISYGPRVRTSKNSVDLRGMRVVEATLEVEMAIATRGPNSILFIIHGMGTGVLKEHVLELLRNHPRIAKFEPEDPMNDGCTVAYIK